jgi:hypothetical protein
MKRQQLLDGSAMIRNPSGRGHGWRPLGIPPACRSCRQVETCVRRPEVVDGPDHIHPLVQRQRPAQQRPTVTCERCQVYCQMPCPLSQPCPHLLTKVKRYGRYGFLGPYPHRSGIQVFRMGDRHAVWALWHAGVPTPLPWG